MRITTENDLKNILEKLSGILTYKIAAPGAVDEVREVLKCAYGIFRSWKSKLDPLLTGTYTADTFWPLFEEFTHECKNGSWSQMYRHNNDIVKYKKPLFSSVKSLLSVGPKIGLAVEIMRDVTDLKRLNKIKGLTPFQLSGILFAFDEDNFMILDGPVLKCFGISDYSRALSEYKTIIDTSKGYSKRFNLPMWYVNKAYGILSNDSVLKLKPLCWQCRSKKSKPLSYSFR